MRQLKTIFAITMAMAFIVPVQAQFINKLKRQIGNTLEDHAADQVNKGVDRALRKVEDKMWEKMFGVKKSTMDSLAVAAESDPEAYEKMLDKYSLGGADIPIGDEYGFSSNAKYKMSTTSDHKGKETTMDYTMLLNPQSKYMGTQLGSMESDGKQSKMPMNMTTIMDYEANAIIMIMEEQKMITVMSMDKLSDYQESELASNNMTIKKTGKTKEILGYNSEEYLLASDDMEGNIWIAPDVDAFNHLMLGNLGNPAFANNSELMDVEGMMMEMYMTISEERKKKPSKLTMQIVSMDKQQVSFDMNDYKKLSMGSMKDE